MARLAAELLLLLGLLILTIHITVLRSIPLGQQADNSTEERTAQNSVNMGKSPPASSARTADLVREYDGKGDASRYQTEHRTFPKPQTLQEDARAPFQRDGPRTFLLDLENFPDLSKVDINGQNPNIQGICESDIEMGLAGDGVERDTNRTKLWNEKQAHTIPPISVTIEVVDGTEIEAERDLRKVTKPSWPVPSSDWRNWWQKSSATAPRNDGSQENSRAGEDSNFLNPVGSWDRSTVTHRRWQSKGQAEYDYADGEGDWSPWSLCSVTCGSGNQKRTRSCGYACTATESRSCDMPNCPGIEDTFKTAATEMSLMAGGEDINATELFGIDTDSCERWMNCKSEFLKKYMHKVLNDLPSCPCSYPTEIAYSTTDIFDQPKQKDFRWKDASGPKERLEIYKPTAHYCIRSMLSLESTTLAAQHCCYDDNMQLITRGKGGGTPNLISTEFSADLHYKVDILPWIICKGDWSRYNEVRPPNNGLKCTDNPSDEVYERQFREAREY